MSYGLGIDVGATFIKAAVSREGRTEPAALSEHSTLQPTGLGDHEPTSMAWTLADVVAKVTAGEADPPAVVAVAHPANWNPGRRAALHLAAVDVGLDSLTLTTASEAAASAYATSHPLSPGSLMAVYDLGSHSFQVSAFRVIGSKVGLVGTPVTIDSVGGETFDNELVEHVRRTACESATATESHCLSGETMHQVRADCTDAAQRLSHLDETTVMVLSPGLNTEVRLTRSTLEALIRPHLDRTINAVRQCLHTAGAAPQDLAGILLVGGSSQIPLVPRMLSDALGLRILKYVDPQYANAFGAAQIAATLIPGSTDSSATSPPPARPRALAVVVTLVALAVTAIAGTCLTQSVNDTVSQRSEALPAPVTTPATSSTTSRTMARSTATTAERATVERHTSNASGRSENSKPAGAVRAASSRSSQRNKQGPNISPVERKVEKSITGRTHTVQSTPKAELPAFAGVVTGPDGMCLDVANGRTTDGTVVQLSTCNDSAAQKWTAPDDGTIQVLGACLDVDTPTDQGTTVGVSSCDGSTAQSWRVSADRFVSARTGKCLAVRGGETDDRTPLVPATCSDSVAQRWTLP